MKRNIFITVAILGAFLLGSSTYLQNESYKIGYIDSIELISLMPGYSEAELQLKKYGEQLDADYKVMLEDYQTQLEDYDKMKDMLTEAMKKAKQQDIVNLQAKIQQYEMDAQQDLAAKEQELLAPMLKRANTAINDVAKESGFRYVFDTQAGAIVYAEDGDNIMPLVKKKLGIE